MLKKYDGLINLDATMAASLFERVDNPWEVLPLIGDYIKELIPNLSDEYINYGDDVYIHKSCKVSDKSTLIGPAIIDEGTEIRPGAFIRGKVIIGKNCVIGNSTESKNAIISDNCQCPHYNYVCDCILGEYAHTGAGVILSNLKSTKEHVNVIVDGEKIDSGLRKFSAILGVNVEIGCNSVVFPGTIVYPNTIVYPLTRVRGTIGANKIVKEADLIIDRKEK